MPLPGAPWDRSREGGGASVRPAAIAGTWYPSDPGALRKDLERHLSRVEAPSLLCALPAAFITPHAGYQWSGACAAHLYRTLQGPAGERIDRVILLAPSHYALVGGLSILPVRAYETPLGRVPVDLEAASALLERPGFRTVEEAHREEHADEIQLPFLQAILAREWKLLDLVVQGTGPSDWDTIAGELLPWVDETTLLVASSDFTHYGLRFGYVPFADEIPENLRRLDMGAVEAALKVDPGAWAEYRRRTGITACGFEPIGILLALLRRIPARLPGVSRFEGRLLDYYRSGDLNGDFSSSVSYAAILFEPVEDEIALGDLNQAEQAFLLGLARRTLETYLGDGSLPAPAIPPHLDARQLRAKRGVFVTLRSGGRLRGCIGSILPQDPLVEGVIRQTVQAAVDDPRFPPVAAEELQGIRIEISVLTPLRRVADPGRIVLRRDGILLEQGPAKAIFLPQVAAEQGWDLAATLDHLAVKAGLPAEAWRSPETIFWTFEAQVFAEAQDRT